MKRPCGGAPRAESPEPEDQVPGSGHSVLNEHAFAVIAEQASELIMIADGESILQWANDAFGRVLGYPPESLIGRSPFSMIHEDDQARLHDVIQRLAPTPGAQGEATFRWRAVDGSWRWLDSRATNLLHDPAVAGFVVSMRDRTTERALKTEERLTAARYEALFEEAKDAICIVSAEGGFIRVNHAFNSLMGCSDEELQDCDFWAFVPAEEHERAKELLRVLRTEGLDRPTAFTLQTSSGRRFCSEVTARVVAIPGEAPQIEAVIRDMSERAQLETALREQALHDGLTGLPNRSLFLERTSSMLAATAGGAGSVVVALLDLDDFKAVNDTLGHAAGDELLKDVALRLRSATRAAETVARLGGDEFAVVAGPVHDAAGASALAARLLATFSNPFTVGRARRHVNASVGVAIGARDASPDDLLRQADTAMYSAKRTGTNRYALFGAQLEAEVHRRVGLAEELRRAVKGEELEAHYQPIVNLATGDVVAVEALARWTSPTLGRIGPVEFVPLAEQEGIAHELGQSIRAAAFAALARWRGERPSCLPDGVFVNVSAGELRHPRLVSGLLNQLAAEGLQPDDVAVELTETSFIDEKDEVIFSSLLELHRLGFRLVLDDFGTGYSALASIRAFPLSALKLDRQFVLTITGPDAPAPIARAVVSLGRSLGLLTIAEGVENAVQLDYLRRIGCDAGQGYVISRPQDETAIAPLILAEGDHQTGEAASSPPSRRARRPGDGWLAPAIPDDEEARLHALRRYGVLDTRPEPVFDEIATLACEICETPMAFVSLVDREREFFKAAIGSELRESPRDISFCGHAILTTELFVVPDTIEDERFAANPNVLGGPGVRSYAGAPLVTPDGHVIGELCVKDVRPRIFTAKQLRALGTLAEQVVAQLDRRSLIAAQASVHEAANRTAAELVAVNDHHVALLDRIEDGVLGVDRENRILHANRAACRALGYTLTELVGRDGHALLHHSHADGSPYPDEQCTFRRLGQRRETRWQNGEVLWRKDGTWFPVEHAVVPLLRNGDEDGWLLLFHDLTGRAAA